jgi:uncharacterized membrane-anchored protein YhcB (DUF1043 family)
MDSSIWIAVIGGAVAVLVAYITSRYTNRAAKDAQQQTRELEEKKLDSSTWQAQVSGWREDALKLRELRDADRREFETEIAECHQKMDETQDQVRQLREALDVVMGERARERAYLIQVQSWCRQIVVLLKGSGIQYPPAPPGLVDDADPYRPSNL